MTKHTVSPKGAINNVSTGAACGLFQPFPNQMQTVIRGVGTLIRYCISGIVSVSDEIHSLADKCKLWLLLPRISYNV